MNTTLNRYSILSEDVSSAMRFTLKYCEHCRISFLSSRDDVRFPGDYINMQRGVGRREPALCGACQKIPLDVLYMRKEAMVMEEIAREIRASRDQFQPTSALRDSKREYAQKDHRSARRHYYAKWREPLMKALLEKGELNAREIATIIGTDLTNATAVAMAPSRVRDCGISLVVSRIEEFHHTEFGGLRRRRYYTLSSSATPEPLTPPQESETHQFMREVHV